MPNCNIIFYLKYPFKVFHFVLEVRKYLNLFIGILLGFYHLGSSLAITILSKNTKSDGVTPEAQLQVRLKFWRVVELTEGIID